MAYSALIDPTTGKILLPIIPDTGLVDQWSTEPAVSAVDFAGFNANNIGTLGATTGNIGTLNSTTGTITTLGSTTGNIGTLTAPTLNSTTGTITTLTAPTLNSTTGTITTLGSTTANITTINSTSVVPAQASFTLSAGDAILQFIPDAGDNWTDSYNSGLSFVAPRSGVYIVSYRVKISHQATATQINTNAGGDYIPYINPPDRSDALFFYLTPTPGAGAKATAVMTDFQKSGVSADSAFFYNFIVLETLVAGTSYELKFDIWNGSHALSWDTTQSTVSCVAVPLC